MQVGEQLLLLFRVEEVLPAPDLVQAEGPFALQSHLFLLGKWPFYYDGVAIHDIGVWLQYIRCATPVPFLSVETRIFLDECME